MTSPPDPLQPVSTDGTAADNARSLNAVLAAYATHDIFVPAGRYRVEGSLVVLRSGTNLRGEGAGSVLEFVAEAGGARVRAGLRATNVDDLVVRDLRLDGTSPTGVVRALHGIHLQGVRRVRLHHLMVRGFLLDGIHLAGRTDEGGRFSDRLSEDIEIAGCRLIGNHRSALALARGQDINVHDNFLDGAPDAPPPIDSGGARAMVRVEPAGNQAVRRLRIARNRIVRARSDGITLNAIVSSENFADHAIVTNTIHLAGGGPDATAIAVLGRARRVTITANIVTGSPRVGVKVAARADDDGPAPSDIVINANVLSTDWWADDVEVAAGEGQGIFVTDGARRVTVVANNVGAFPERIVVARADFAPSRAALGDAALEYEGLTEVPDVDEADQTRMVAVVANCCEPPTNTSEAYRDDGAGAEDQPGTGGQILLLAAKDVAVAGNLANVSANAQPIVDNYYNESLLPGGVVLNRLLTPRRHGVVTHMHSGIATFSFDEYFPGVLAVRSLQTAELRVPVAGARSGDAVTIHITPPLDSSLASDAVALADEVVVRIHNVGAVVRVIWSLTIRADAWRVAQVGSDVRMLEGLDRERR